MKLRDLKGLFKSNVLTVKSVESKAQDYYEIHLDLPIGMHYRPGEHGIFTIKGKKFKGRKWHVFSLASIKEEGEIILGTRTGDTPSPYKETLINLEKGDKVKLRGPFGWFVFEENSAKPVILIALGVGITPVRALMMSAKGTDKEVDVIYSASDYHLFKEDLDDVVTHSKNINIHYFDNQLETANNIVKKAKLLQNDARYFISGKVKSIKSIKKLLKNEGIKSKNIVHDPFFGY